MATASGNTTRRGSGRSSATSRKPPKDEVKTFLFEWQGTDKRGKIVRGDLRAASETVVRSTLQRQGIHIVKE